MNRGGGFILLFPAYPRPLFLVTIDAEDCSMSHVQCSDGYRYRAANRNFDKISIHEQIQPIYIYTTPAGNIGPVCNLIPNTVTKITPPLGRISRQSTPKQGGHIRTAKITVFDRSRPDLSIDFVQIFP